MASSADLRSKIEVMEKKLADLKDQERAVALKSARALVAQWNFTLQELQMNSAAPTKKVAMKRKTTKVERPIKFVNPKTGDSWNGWGKPPKWIPKDAEKRKAFLVGATPAADKASSPPVPAAAVVTPKKVAKKVSRAVKKPAAKKAAKKDAPAKAATKAVAPAEKPPAKPAKKAAAKVSKKATNGSAKAPVKAKLAKPAAAGVVKAAAKPAGAKPAAKKMSSKQPAKKATVVAAPKHVTEPAAAAA